MCDTKVLILGHKGHGKTTLVRGLTFVASDFELDRGLFYYDCASDGSFYKELRMITADCGVLVVDVTEGPMPQTREHLLIARQIGVTNMYVFLNKRGSETVEQVNLVESEVKALLDWYDYASIPVFSGSALHLDDLSSLYAALVAVKKDV